MKNKENQLNDIISRFPFELSNNEYLMVVNFKLKNNNFSSICKNTDQFIIVESLIYKKYPEYEDIINLFLVNGRQVKRFRSFEENGIKNNDIILALEK